MEIQYDKSIEVTESQYNACMSRLDGYVAGRKENGKFYIKIWFMKYKYLLEAILKKQ